MAPLVFLGQSGQNARVTFPRASLIALSCMVSGPAWAQATAVDAAPVAVTPAVGNEAPPWADDALPPPSDDPPPPSARTNLLLTGAAVTVGFYGLGFGTSYLWPSSPVAEDLRIPVVGAYTAVFDAGCGASERGCTTFVAVLRTTLAAISGLGQTGGVFLLGEALFLDTDEGSTATSGTSTHSFTSAESEVAAPQVYYAPVIDEHSVGMVLGGSF